MVLLLGGVAMAATALLAALSRHLPGQAWAFLAVGVVLGATAVAVARGVRWVIVVCFVGLAGQSAAIAGTTAELVLGVATIKQEQLRGLGFDPTIAVALNLVYSAIGFGLFCWLGARWWIRRRRDRTARLRMGAVARAAALAEQDDPHGLP